METEVGTKMRHQVSIPKRVSTEGFDPLFDHTISESSCGLSWSTRFCDCTIIGTRKLLVSPSGAYLLGVLMSRSVFSVMQFATAGNGKNWTATVLETHKQTSVPKTRSTRALIEAGKPV